MRFQLKLGSGSATARYPALPQPSESTGSAKPAMNTTTALMSTNPFRSRGTTPPINSTSPHSAILKGEIFVSTFSGTSQFTAEGFSACGVASFNALREVLSLSQSSNDLNRTLDEINRRSFHEVGEMPPYDCNNLP